MTATTAAFRRPDGAGRLDGVVGDRLYSAYIAGKYIKPAWLPLELIEP